MKNHLTILQTVLTFDTIKGVSFVGLKGYENKSGEISNQTINVGASWQNVLKKDLEKIKSFDTTEIQKEFGAEITAKAYDKVFNSISKRLATEEQKAVMLKNGDKTIVASEGQNKAYIYIATGVAFNPNTEQLYVSGISVSKTVVKKGEYKTSNKQQLTIVQDAIKKAASLGETKFRRFTFDNVSEVQVRGIKFADNDK